MVVCVCVCVWQVGRENASLRRRKLNFPLAQHAETIKAPPRNSRYPLLLRTQRNFAVTLRRGRRFKDSSWKIGGEIFVDGNPMDEKVFKAYCTYVTKVRPNSIIEVLGHNDSTPATGPPDLGIADSARESTVHCRT